MLYELFPSKRISTWPRQTIEMTLKRAAIHVKVTRPPYLSRLLPWKKRKRINNS